MQLSKESDKSGLIQDVQFLARVGADTTAYPIADIVRNLNRAYDRTSFLIMSADGSALWDDDNYSDQPIDLSTITTDQQDYTFDVTQLTPTNVLVKSEAGVWRELTQVDESEEGIVATFENNLANGPSGNPTHYNWKGESLLLYPKPSYTQASSLMIWYQRGASYFSVPTDYTDAGEATNDKVPGFASHLHRFLSVSAALDYAGVHPLDPQHLAFLREEKRRYEGTEQRNFTDGAIVSHYASRNSYRRSRLKSRVINAI